MICTRPAAIKMAPVIHALQQHDAFNSTVCLTGQHREMLHPVLKIFQIKPDMNLDIMRDNQDLFDVTARVLLGLRDLFSKNKPDVILTQGDTTSTFAASLAAFYFKIPVGHVEAGLRTHQLYSPFPEEANRAMTTRLATWHFAPTSISKKNLLAENILAENITVTGNTVIDALLWMRDRVNQKKDWSSELGAHIQALINRQTPIILITGHRRENFGSGFKQVCSALAVLARKHPDWHFIYPVHLNPNVQKPVQAILSGLDNFHLITPLDYAPFVYLMDKAKMIITDSGGIQEEAPSLGKPVLVTREVTERPEGVDAGVVLLVGTSEEKIIAETESVMSDQNRYVTMARIQNPYGDGKAAMRIVDFLAQKLLARSVV